jgi:hypothetical protein
MRTRLGTCPGCRRTGPPASSWRSGAGRRASSGGRWSRRRSGRCGTAGALRRLTRPSAPLEGDQGRQGLTGGRHRLRRCPHVPPQLERRPVKRPSARVTGQAAGDAEQAAAPLDPTARIPRRSRLCARTASTTVCAACTLHGPGAVGVEVPGGEVRQRWVFEIADDLFDDGVVAVLGLDHGEVIGAVGDEAEVPPVGPGLGLRTDQPGAPDDQPPPAVDAASKRGRAAGR